MKEAAGELNMTIIVIIAAGAILLFLSSELWPRIREDILERWDKTKETEFETHEMMETRFIEII
jgi:hypothetical protein